MRLASTIGVAVASLVAACFDPRAPVGAPCDPGGPCPSGQVCTGAPGGTFTCQLAGSPAGGDDGGIVVPQADAAGDAMNPPLPDGGSGSTPTDTDGDGITDLLDNCPTVANADQHDEDNDKRGDVCDICPISGNTSDTDGDGVGNSCDPHNGTTGDAIYLFDGFQDAATVATGWDPFGNWSANGDTTEIDGNPSHANLGYPMAMPPTAGETITTLLNITSTNAVASPIAGAGVMTKKNASSEDGIACELITNAGVASLAIVDVGGASILASAPAAWTTGTNYKLVLTRSDSSYNCTCTTLGVGPITATASPTPGSPEIGLRVTSTSAVFDWILVVTSP